jgi:HSP20 family molecular chaperone IbpA
MVALRPAKGHTRVEDFFEDGKYMVRAELAGVDPAKDIEITIDAGFLTIRAERYDKAEGKHRSEFRYGTFDRSVMLPAHIDEDKVTASYDNGILTVSVPLEAPEKVAARNVHIAQAT